MMRRLLAAGAAGVLFAAALATPAAAANPPDGPDVWCTLGDDYVVSCFEKDGDDFWVWDREYDSASAQIDWWTDYGRSGYCRNTTGVATWKECAYDLAENSTVYWTHSTFDQTTGVKTYRSGIYATSTSS